MKENINAAMFAASNALKPGQTEDVYRLIDLLGGLGEKVILSEFLFTESTCSEKKISSVCSGSPEAKAAELNAYFANSEIKNIYDVSGGDLANGILPYLDYDVIKASPAKYWGYSDNTTVINAIYKMTGKSSTLYQIRNLIGEAGEQQTQNFLEEDRLFDFNYEFIRGSQIEGVVLGGNIRCLLKLAGTKFMPNFSEKILFLESFSGRTARISSYFFQLEQLGVFAEISGLILGSFTELFEKDGKDSLLEIVEEIVPDGIPVACTDEIGHGANSKALRIGESLNLSRD